nr:immunoglobulin light chain junction region [Macaca mulatta]MOW02028.1 immunoglobulin light chain junction region [Macaca mulatta]MOW02187.1 immunoglobulin light chain junction region [Macaca mulatta]MOW02696.1 immunoglobulin light chain junction region [Macaca mulatta]MOW02849.1 immunoglobulin light chain junction region [Macaca mulatta]
DYYCYSTDSSGNHYIF